MIYCIKYYKIEERRMHLTLYTKDDCPRCDMLKAKLNAKNISFVEIKDESVIEALGIDFLPVLQVGEEFMQLSKANDFINSL